MHLIYDPKGGVREGEGVGRSSYSTGWLLSTAKELGGGGGGQGRKAKHHNPFKLTNPTGDFRISATQAVLGFKYH